MDEPEPELTRTQIALLDRLPRADQAELAPMMYGRCLIECEGLVSSRRRELELAAHQAEDEAALEDRETLRFWGI